MVEPLGYTWQPPAAGVRSPLGRTYCIPARLAGYSLVVEHPALVGYSMAVGAALLAWGLHLALSALVPVLVQEVALYGAAVLVMAWEWGPGPAAVCAGLLVVLITWVTPLVTRTANILVRLHALAFGQTLVGMVVTSVSFVLLGVLVGLARLRHRRAQEALARSLAEVVAADVRKDEFFALASHELRTPLTSLSLLLQMTVKTMRREDPARPPETRVLEVMEQLTMTSTQVARLTRLVNEMLDDARAARGTLRCTLESLDLVEVVRSTVERRRLDEGMGGRALLLRASQTPLYVEGDPVRLEQVIDHLLSNALKFSPSVEPVEVLVLHESSGGRPYARVSVLDHGPGLPAEEQERVWDRFYQAPGVIRAQGSEIGLGLGLYLARAVIMQLGGEVGLQSAPQAGAVFWFRLPLLMEGVGLTTQGTVRDERPVS